MHDLLEPICLVNFFSDEPTAELEALGFTGYWDGYFAGRAAPLGLVSALVVDAAFYSFAEGEVARHIPAVWRTASPTASYEARSRGCARALRRILEADADPGADTDVDPDPDTDALQIVRVVELLTRCAVSAPVEGRVMYAALRSLPTPADQVTTLWHVANMLREHRGDGHNAVLVSEQIGGTEAHVLNALDQGIHPPHTFGRIHHLPQARLDEVMDGLRGRGIVDEDDRFTDFGRLLKARIEHRTDALAAAPYRALSALERNDLRTLLAPLAAMLEATGSR
ncbi:MarR family transcriptional regulator [Yimella sp. cx-51]|nr:MarR family transcriptional regulator [Yimella sp. cx-51]